MTISPLLTLTMIVKDEAPSVARTLESVRPYVDAWCILDTGSTDATPEIVRSTMRGVPGSIHVEPFVDFSTSRNRGLQLCGTDGEFILWLDADDVLLGGDALRRQLDAERNQIGPDREAYYVRVQTPGAAFDSARVVRSRAGWRFVGAVHEVLMHPDRAPPSVRLEGVTVRHVPDRASGERSRARWERDARLLEQEFVRDPSAARAAFYLGMTYLWLGRYAEAMTALDRRIALGGWSEEVFYAKLSKARAARGANLPWPQVLAAYLDAHAAAAHRAEPLVDISLHYDAENHHALAFLFARRAYELPFPSADTLFVEEEAYRWRAADLVGAHAYWIGEFEIGEQAARKAVQARPGDARLAANLRFYSARKGDG